jgi:hypothetical protein
LRESRVWRRAVPPAETAKGRKMRDVVAAQHAVELEMRIL